MKYTPDFLKVKKIPSLFPLSDSSGLYGSKPAHYYSPRPIRTPCGPLSAPEPSETGWIPATDGANDPKTPQTSPVHCVKVPEPPTTLGMNPHVHGRHR